MPEARGFVATDILGVPVGAIDLGRAVELIGGWVDTKHRTYVCIADVHAIMQSQWAEEFNRIHNAAGLVTPDGMPLVWLCRRAGHTATGRVYGPDLMLALCGTARERPLRHFFYGGLPGVAAELANRLQQRFPHLEVAGTYCPPLRALSETEKENVAAQLNDAAPDIVWVGLSTPKQERWMALMRSRLDAPVLIGVGAAFDFHSGRKRQAPKWLQRNGLEWLFRLALEPRRLWRRYATCVPAFLFLIARRELRTWRARHGSIGS